MIKSFILALVARRPIAYALMGIFTVYMILTSIVSYIEQRTIKISKLDQSKTQFLKELDAKITPLQKDLTATLLTEEKLTNQLNSLQKCRDGVNNTLGTTNFFDCNENGLLPKAMASNDASSGTGNGSPEVADPSPNGGEFEAMSSEPILLTGARIVNEITIHHTETPNVSEDLQLKSIARNHEQRLHETASCYGFTIGYHYIIGRTGNLYKTRCENEIGYHNSKNNGTSIGIALLGNGNVEPFTDAQYAKLRELINVIKSRQNINNVTGHWGWNGTCPGKLFDPTRILSSKQGTFIGTYGITRYYTPTRGQKTYLWSKTFEAAFNLNCQYKPGRPYGGCLDTASGYKLQTSDAFRKAACPPNFKHNTKLYVEGLGEVECVDRGGAIKNKRLDVWAGIGEQGIKNLSIKNGGKRKVYILN